MAINTIFMNSLVYQSVQNRFKNDVKYNDPVFLYTLEFQSPLTTVKEIASTQATLLQENKEADTKIEAFEKKSDYSST